MITKMLNNLFGCRKMEELTKENAILKEKLQERQEVINQTNAYWKRKLFHLKKKSSL